MITTFDIAREGKKFSPGAQSVGRLEEYATYRNLYENNFAAAFPSTFSKIIKKYPFESTTAQTLVEQKIGYGKTQAQNNSKAQNYKNKNTTFHDDPPF